MIDNRRKSRPKWQSRTFRARYDFSDQWQVLEERVDSSTTADKQYVWGQRYVDDLVLRDTPSERLYALQDALFNVVAFTDDAGVVKERFAYQPYGQSEELNPDFSSYSGNDYQWEVRFTGRELDLVSRLIDFRFRLFSPQLGRFIERDPFSYNYLDTLNLYAYASGRPVSARDPYGLQSAADYPINPGMNPAAIAAAIAALRALLAINWWNVAIAATIIAAIACLTNILRVCIPGYNACAARAVGKAGVDIAGYCRKLGKRWAGDFMEAREISRARCVNRIYNMHLKKCDSAWSSCVVRCGIGGFKQPAFGKPPKGICDEFCEDIPCIA